MSISGSDLALMQARSGIARSGATRSDFFYGSLALTIGGIDRAAKVRKGSLKIVDTLNEQADTASLQVFGFNPSVGQEIVIGNGAINNRVFAGHIVRAEQQSVKKAAQTFWLLDCTDYMWILNKTLVTKRYGAQSASLIAADLVTSFSSGFTTSNIKAGAPSTGAIMEFKGTRLGDALTRVANAASWNWYPDFNKSIHFFDTETAQAPRDIDENNLGYENFIWRPAIDQVRTRIYVEGGGGQATAPIAVGTTTLAIDECAWYSSSGGTVVSGSNLITYTGRSATSGPGTITGVPATGAGSVLYDIKQGDAINIWVQCDDTIAQSALAVLEGGNGVHEYYIQDQRLSVAGATSRGQSELALFSTIDYQGTYDSRDKFNRSGKSVNVNLPARGIAGVILQQQVVRRYVAQDRWGFQVKFKRVRRDFFDILRELQRAGAA